MSEPAPVSAMWERKPTQSKGRLIVLLVLVALVVAGLWAYRDYFGPAKVWRRAIHSTIAKVRSDHWALLRRENTIVGLDRAETIREVFKSLDDPDTTTRIEAVTSVASVKAEPLEAIPRLADKLDDKIPEVRSKAMLAIGEVFQRGGPGRDEAIFALSKALKDQDASVRVSAVMALGQVIYASGESADPLRSGRPNDPALALILARLQDDDVAVRVEAACVLASNDRGEEAVDRLISFLRLQSKPAVFDHLADRAFLTLMVMAVRSDEAAAFLASELNIDREGYPDRPRDALAWAARQTPEARARIRRLAGEALVSKNATVRHSAAILMHEIGSGRTALPELIAALSDPSIDTRIRAVEALADMGDIDPLIVPALETATRDSSFEVRERAAGALEAIELDGMM